MGCGRIKVVSFESSIQRCVFNKMSLDVKDFTIGTLKVWSGLYQESELAGCLIHGPFVLAHSMGLLWRRIGIPIYFDMLIVHGQNSPCSGEMQTELLMFREMPSMPLDFPGPKHGSTCFHQNPVVFARPGLAMGLKKNENDGPVCRLSHMNRDKWEKEWKIRSPSWYHHFFPRIWNCFLGCATDFWWSLAFGDTSTSCFCLDLS